MLLETLFDEENAALNSGNMFTVNFLLLIIYSLRTFIFESIQPLNSFGSRVWTIE